MTLKIITVATTASAHKTAFNGPVNKFGPWGKLIGEPWHGYHCENQSC